MSELDKYEFVSVLSPYNEASNATIHKAKSHADGQWCAIKEINKRAILEADPTRAKVWEMRFENEVAAHRSTLSNFVVAFKESFECNEKIFIVMELYNGQQLFDLVTSSNNGHLEEYESAEIFQQLVQGVMAIHDAGYIHRDLKPENVLCCRGGGGVGNVDIKILDFGAAKKLVYSPEHDRSFSLVASVTGTMAWNTTPERGYGEAESTSADMWALGCILYFMLVGNAPFRNLAEEEDDEAVLDKIMDAPLSWPQGIEVSKQVKNLVEGLLDKNEDERPSIEDIQKHPWWNYARGLSQNVARVGIRDNDSLSLAALKKQLNFMVDFAGDK